VASVKPELLSFPPEVEARLNALIAAGDHEGTLETFMRDVVMVSEADLGAVRAQPTWQARVAAAPTITREIRALFDHMFDLEQAAKITVPVLVLTGADTPDEIKDDPEAVAAALPDARIVVLEGQQHIADVLVPEVFAEHILSFLRDRR
jgi:pimeloyl-ACP methyl ester carboxylesterase